MIYDGPEGDYDEDGVIIDIERWARDQQLSPEEREQNWIEENLHPQGLSADLVTREIIDPQGRVVGRLPDFQGGE
jgi:hypothetical protein